MSTPAATARRSSLIDWLPVVVWAAVIFAFSSVPSLATDLEGWDTVLRKLAHLGEYGLLGALLVRACRRAGLAVVLATLYAVSDEVHQMFVEGRRGTPVDVAIDAVGALAGVLFWERLAARRRRA